MKRPFFDRFSYFLLELSHREFLNSDCRFCKTTGHSNLEKHLANKHDKNVKANAASETSQRKLTDLFFNPTKKRKASNDETQTQLQYIFNRQIALWMCRDLLPFSTVTKEGFKDFCFSIKHTPNLALPCRSTISISALDDLYDCFMKRFIAVLDSAPEHGTITFDCWTDSAKRTAYVTYTYHYMQDWSIKTAVENCYVSSPT